MTLDLGGESRYRRLRLTVGAVRRLQEQMQKHPDSAKSLVDAVHRRKEAVKRRKARAGTKGGTWSVDQMDSPTRCKAFSDAVGVLDLPDSTIAKLVHVSRTAVADWRRLGAGEVSHSRRKAPTMAQLRLLLAALEAKRQLVQEAMDAINAEMVGKPRPPPKVRRFPKV